MLISVSTSILMGFPSSSGLRVSNDVLSNHLIIVAHYWVILRFRNSLTVLSELYLSKSLETLLLFVDLHKEPGLTAACVYFGPMWRKNL